jgi:hypothetical protein
LIFRFFSAFRLRRLELHTSAATMGKTRSSMVEWFCRRHQVFSVLHSGGPSFRGSAIPGFPASYSKSESKAHRSRPQSAPGIRVSDSTDRQRYAYTVCIHGHIDCYSPARAAAAIEIYDAAASRGLNCARSRGNAGYITNDSLRNAFPGLSASTAHPLSNRVEQAIGRIYFIY